MRADRPFTAASAGPTALSPELGYFPRIIARGRPDRVGGGSSSSMGCVFESLSSVDEGAFGGKRGERLLARLRLEATVERNLPWREAKPLEL